MLRLCDTQWPNSGLFLQNALVEYIGVYSDTNKHIDYISISKYARRLFFRILSPELQKKKKKEKEKEIYKGL